jgi:hypothetical protein
MAAAVIPFFALFVHYDRQSLGLILSCVTGVFLTVVYVKRSSALRWKFIARMSVLYIIHVIIVLNLPIPDKIPGFIMIPLSFADLVAVLALLHFLDNLEKDSMK